MRAKESDNLKEINEATRDLWIQAQFDDDYWQHKMILKFLVSLCIIKRIECIINLNFSFKFAILNQAYLFVIWEGLASNEKKAKKYVIVYHPIGRVI